MLGKKEIGKSLFAFYVIVGMHLVRHFLIIGLLELRALKVRDRNLESSFERLIIASNNNNFQTQNFQTQNFLHKDFIVIDAFCKTSAANKMRMVE